MNFIKWLQLREETNMCKKCGKPTPENELNTYGGRCEDCAIGNFNAKWGTNNNSPAKAFSASGGGARIVDKSEPMAG